LINREGEKQGRKGSLISQGGENPGGGFLKGWVDRSARIDPGECFLEKRRPQKGGERPHSFEKDVTPQKGKKRPL